MSGIPFCYKDGLLYRKEENGADRLYIPKNAEKDVFKLAHNDRFHTGFNRAYTTVRDTCYVHSLSKKLKTYIQYYHQCRTAQTTRHRPYGSLQPISLQRNDNSRPKAKTVNKHGKTCHLPQTPLVKNSKSHSDLL